MPLLPVQTGGWDDGQSLLGEESVYSLDSVDCVLNRSVLHGSGTLFLMPSHLVFLSSREEDFSLVVDYKAIGVHAICHSQDIYPKECIYCQVSDPAAEGEWTSYESPCCAADDAYGEEAGESGVAELCQPPCSSIEEVLFSPNDLSQLQSLFDHITELQNMNSEEEDELGDLAFTCDLDSLLNHSVNYC
ncbi:hypothetical protein BLSTO_00416 [Blastocystis sp. subtype 1]